MTVRPRILLATIAIAALATAARAVTLNPDAIVDGLIYMLFEAECAAQPVDRRECVAVAQAGNDRATGIRSGRRH